MCGVETKQQHKDHGESSSAAEKAPLCPRVIAKGAPPHKVPVINLGPAVNKALPFPRRRGDAKLNVEMREPESPQNGARKGKVENDIEREKEGAEHLRAAKEEAHDIERKGEDPQNDAKHGQHRDGRVPLTERHVVAEIVHSEQVVGDKGNVEANPDRQRHGADGEKERICHDVNERRTNVFFLV